MDRLSQTIKKIVCQLKGHTGFKRDAVYVRHYIEIPAGRGAFCRAPKRYKYGGRLYRCARCNELLLIHGILSWEVSGLIEDTLQGLTWAWFNFDQQSYDFARFYK